MWAKKDIQKAAIKVEVGYYMAVGLLSGLAPAEMVVESHHFKEI